MTRDYLKMSTILSQVTQITKWTELVNGHPKVHTSS